MSKPSHLDVPDQGVIARKDGSLSQDLPPNLAKRIQEVEQERENGLLLTHEDVLKQIRSWPAR